MYMAVIQLGDPTLGLVLSDQKLSCRAVVDRLPFVVF